jgi:Ca2+-binding EF-hand superfamily protein
LTLVDDKKDLHVALLADYASRENLSQLEDVSKLFASLDVDNDGTVTAEETRKGLAGKMPPDQIDTLIKAMMSENGEIAYTQFMGHMIAQKQQSVTKMLYKLFQDIDEDSSGYLDLNEIQEMLERPQVAEVMAGKTAPQLMAEIDMNNTGRISWPEFQMYLDRRLNGELAVNGWRPGQDAEYLSSTHNIWVACKVTGVNPQSQTIMLSCKPGAWINPAAVRRPRKFAVQGEVDN